MNEPMTTGVTGGEFAIDGHTASHFLAAHLSILHARTLIKCADEALLDDDPVDILHEARIEAAEAQHHIRRAAENSTELNAPHVVIGLLGPLLDELELKLDAIRYRAHTPFGDNPAWWRDLDLDLSSLPDELMAESPDDAEHKVVRLKRVEVNDDPRDVNVRRIAPDDNQADN